MEETNKMNETTKKEEQTSTQKIGIYLWIWLLLFVLSFFSYMVDWYQFQGMLRWSLILFFMFLKAGLIMAFFMHLFWERYALVNVLLWPMTAIACFIFLMTAEFKYTLFSRFFYTILKFWCIFMRNDAKFLKIWFPPSLGSIILPTAPKEFLF